MGMNRNINFHTRRHMITDHITDTANCLTSEGRLLGNFNNNDLTRLGFT